MKPKTLSFKQLKNTGNFEHLQCGIEVELDTQDDIEQVLDSMKAFVELHVTPGLAHRLAMAKQILLETTDTKDYKNEVARNLIEDKGDIIERAARITNRL